MRFASLKLRANFCEERISVMDGGGDKNRKICSVRRRFNLKIQIQRIIDYVR